MIYALLIGLLVVFLASALLKSVAIGGIGGLLLIVLLVVLLTGRA